MFITPDIGITKRNVGRVKMNERIGQLAEQAGLLGPSSRIGNSHDAAERFAQLIVRECADIALREEHDPYECIKRHFGLD